MELWLINQSVHVTLQVILFAVGVSGLYKQYKLKKTIQYKWVTNCYITNKT